MNEGDSSPPFGATSSHSRIQARFVEFTECSYAEGRVGEHVVELVGVELVVTERVAELDAAHVLALAPDAGETTHDARPRMRQPRYAARRYQPRGINWRSAVHLVMERTETCRAIVRRKSPILVR